MCVGGGGGGGGGAHYIRMGSMDEQTKVVLFSLIGSGGGIPTGLESGGGGRGGKLP